MFSLQWSDFFFNHYLIKTKRYNYSSSLRRQKSIPLFKKTWTPVSSLKLFKLSQLTFKPWFFSVHIVIMWTSRDICIFSYLYLLRVPACLSTSLIVSDPPLCCRGLLLQSGVRMVMTVVPGKASAIHSCRTPRLFLSFGLFIQSPPESCSGYWAMVCLLIHFQERINSVVFQQPVTLWDMAGDWGISLAGSHVLL